jgi:hypothetical protein
MTRIIPAFRILTLGAVLTGTCLAAGCGSSPPETVSRTMTTEQITSAPPLPPPVVSTTTTTTEQVRQSH